MNIQHMTPQNRQSLCTELKLKDRTFQIMVCADYNFHDVENFKIQYWKLACEKIAAANGDFLISPDMLQHSFSQLQGTGVVLPGLPNIFAKLAEDNVLVSEEKYAQNINNSSQDGWLSSLGTWLMPGSRKRKLTTHVGSFIVQSLVEKVGNEVLKRLGEYEDEYDNILVTYEKLSKKLHEIMPAAKGAHAEALIWWLCNKHGAATFTVDLGPGEEIPGSSGPVKAIKIPPRATGVKTKVDENDKARLAEMIVETKLNRREKELISQLEETDALCRAQLRAGRKTTALMHLKKKKLLENEIKKISDMQLKITQVSSARAAGEVTQDVLKALQQGVSAQKESNVDIDHVQDVVDQAQECFEDAQGINQVLASPSEAISSGIEEEYDDLINEINLEEQKAVELKELDLKEQVLKAGGVPSHRLSDTVKMLGQQQQQYNNNQKKVPMPVNNNNSNGYQNGTSNGHHGHALRSRHADAAHY